MGKKRRTESKKSKVRINIKANKIRRIQKALKTAKGIAIGKLTERLKYWGNK